MLAWILLTISERQPTLLALAAKIFEINIDWNKWMNFAQQQRDPRRHLMGITTVVLVHAIAIYALTNGLAHKVVDVLKKPLDVSIIEELKKAPPPPPPPKVIEPPKVVEPPPAFVPAPEIQVQAPPPVIAVTAPTPPPPVVVAPPIPAPPRVASVGVVCPDHLAVLSKVQVPAQAQGQAGKVIVEFLVSATGTVGDVTVVKSTNRLFNAVATAAVGQLHCIGQGQNVRVQVPFVFEQDR
jgi:protein TonB